MFSQMLRTIHTAMLTASAPEREHKVGEATLHVAFYMSICQFVNTFQEHTYLTVIFKKLNYWLVKTSKLFIWLITSGVVR